MNSSTATVQSALEALTPLNPTLGSRGVSVTTGTDTVAGRNGQVLTVRFFDEGYKNKMIVQQCENSVIQYTVVVKVLSTGMTYGLTALQAGVKNGVVQRGLLTSLFVLGCNTISNASTVLWNAPGEGVTTQTNVSIKSYLESTCPLYLVNVTRTVIGQYGVVEWLVRFVFTKGVSPPGAGNAPILNVVQGAATDNVVYAPIVFEKVQGSIGLSGSYIINVGGLSRLLSYQESALRFKRKLEEYTTIGTVYVERFKFPSNSSGGWSGVGVPDGSRGGYEWRIYFLSNTGTANGFSFPPGSGNVDPIEASVLLSNLGGTEASVEATTYVQGSIPIDGAFTLAYNDAVTDPIRYDQMPLEMKYFLQSTNTIGEVDVSSNFRMMQKLEGVYVTANKDSQTLIVEYDVNGTYSALNPVEPDVRKMLAAGDLFRIGGTGEIMSGSSQSGIDGADLYGLIEVSPLSPLFGRTSSASQEPIYPGETLRVGADDYSVLRTGVEVQTVSIDCGLLGGSSGM